MDTISFWGVPLDLWTTLTNVGLTGGLLIFAGMQWWVTHRAEVTRKREREEEARRGEDLAYQMVWSEHFRLDGLADRLDGADLVEWSALGVLRPGYLLSSDWAEHVRMLGTLSVEAGYLGGVALSLAHDAERSVAALNAIVGTFARQYPQHSPSETVAIARNNRGADLGPIEDDIRRDTRQLALLLWDALQHSRSAEVDRPLNFRDEMISAAGAAAVGALMEREGERGRVGTGSGTPVRNGT